MPADAASGRQEIAVVRHPIADARHVVVGYELRFGGAVDLGDAAMDAKATSALLVEAFGDIGLETLAGRHPAWVSIARNFLLEIGSPPVRPDRAVLQIKAYQAREDLLQMLQTLSRSGYTIALDEWNGDISRNVEELMSLCSIVKVDVSQLRARGPAARSCACPKMQGALLVATERRRPRRLRPLQASSASPTSRASTSPSRAPSSTAASPPPASAPCAACPS